MYKVLIADDETFVRTLLEKNLAASSLPIQVVGAAEDGQEALELSEKYLPDILVTDIAMPFRNGLDLIRELKEREIATKSVIISGYDEFDYARTAIALGVTDYLLKPFTPSELYEVLEKLIRELDSQRVFDQNLERLKKQADRNKLRERYHFFKEVLKGQMPQSCGEELEASLGGAISCLTCVLTLRGSIWEFEDEEKLEEFMGLLRTGYFPAELSFQGICLETKKLVMCFWARRQSEREFVEKVIAGLERFSKSMEQYYDVVPYCTLGRVYSSVRGFCDSCQDALKTWNEALNPQKKIRIYGEKKEEQSFPEHTGLSARIREKKACIRGAVLGANRRESQNLLAQLMRLYVSGASRGSDYIMISAGELIFGIADDLERSGYERPKETQIPNLKAQMGTGSLLELREILENYLDTCCRLVEENQLAKRPEAAVRTVQTWMDEHLKDSELSIEAAAGLVHFSVSYLRQNFKEVTGENFGEYLIRRRMEKAGMFLRDTSMKIQDIARNCGYDNQRYFSSSFKKFYGCTPTEFKEIVEKEKL